MGVGGGRARWTRDWSLLDRPVETQVAVETRNDDVDLGLFRQSAGTASST